MTQRCDGSVTDRQSRPMVTHSVRHSASGFWGLSLPGFESHFHLRKFNFSFREIHRGEVSVHCWWPLFLPGRFRISFRPGSHPSSHRLGCRNCLYHSPPHQQYRPRVTTTAQNRHIRASHTRQRFLSATYTHQFTYYNRINTKTVRNTQIRRQMYPHETFVPWFILTPRY